ncbi:MAG: hypothetical protein ACYTBP_03495 [Planctomycetota bacterium]|jgi:hypothetical protein
MIKRVVILFLMFSLSGVTLGADAERVLLRDGQVLPSTGLDGKLIKADSNDVLLSNFACLNKADSWFFKLDEELKDDKVIVKPGERIQLLPSSALEKMVADLRNNPEAFYRIWGKVTRYRDKNFIFTTYFSPVAKRTRPEPSKRKEIRIAINDPNDELPIPQKVLEKIRNRKVVKPVRLQKGRELTEDSVFVNRIGYIIRKSDGQTVFVPDALGRNVPKMVIRLLPCEIFQITEDRQKREAELSRYKVAGVITKYKKKQYLLLQRATKVYSYGNFDK